MGAGRIWRPSSLCEAIERGQRIDLYNYGRMQRDFTYVDDIVEGLVRVIDRPHTGYRLYNVGHGSPVGLLEFVHTVERALGKRARKRFLPIPPGDVVATHAEVEDFFEYTGLLSRYAGCRWCRAFGGVVPGIFHSAPPRDGGMSSPSLAAIIAISKERKPIRPAGWRPLLRAASLTGSAAVAGGALSVVATKIFAAMLGPAELAVLATLQQIRQAGVTGATLNGQTALVQGASSRERPRAAPVPADGTAVDGNGDGAGVGIGAGRTCVAGVGRPAWAWNVQGSSAGWLRRWCFRRPWCF